MMESEHPAQTSLAQLSAGGGKVSPVKVRDFVEELKIGLNGALSPGVNNLSPCMYAQLFSNWPFPFFPAFPSISWRG